MCTGRFYVGLMPLFNKPSRMGLFGTMLRFSYISLRSLAGEKLMTKILVFSMLMSSATSFASNDVDPKNLNADMASFRGTTEVYSDGHGHFVAVAESFAGGKDNEKYLRNRFFTGNGSSFYQLNEEGFGGTSTEYEMGFTDSRIKDYQSRKIFVGKDGMKVKCGDKEIKFSKVTGEELSKLRESAQFNPTPSERKQEYLARDPSNGDVIFVDASKYNRSYNSFRFFKGPPGHLKELVVKQVDRYRDGGTTYIETESGTFYSPTPSNKDKPLSFTKSGSKTADVLTNLQGSAHEADLAKLIGEDLKSQLEPRLMKTPCDAVFDNIERDDTKPGNKH